MRMPQPRSIDKESAMEDVVVDKEGMGWLKLGHFRANKQDFAFHSDDRLGVRLCLCIQPRVFKSFLRCFAFFYSFDSNASNTSLLRTFFQPGRSFAQ